MAPQNKTLSQKVLDIGMKNSTMVWIRHKKIKNEKGKRIKLGRKSPHFFLRDLYMDNSQEIAVQKPSQIGVSTWAILTELHDGRYWGINQIHTLPTANDVTKFVQSKTNEIIKQNPAVKAGLADKEVDAIAQKQFGKGFLYYLGTVSERATLMITSDRNWYDELDKSDQGNIGFYESRMEGEDSMRQKRYISTPTMPGYGINKVFEESDQKHWRFTCPKCYTEQHMQWPDNIDMEKACYICSRCGKPITEETIRSGGWKAKYPGRRISGYQLTQMIAPWIRPADLIRAYRDAEKGKNDMTMEYFYNHKLGLPYIEASGQIPASVILGNLIDTDHVEVNSVMGVDVQLHELYMMIGREEGVYGIAKVRDDQEYIDTNGKMGKSKWDRWAELMRVYDVRYCVIDGGFTPNEVIKAAGMFPGKVWVNWYKDDPKKEKIIRFGDEEFTGKQKDEVAEIRILTERDRMIDWLLMDLKQGRIRFFYAANSEAIKTLIEHVKTTYARMVTDRLGLSHREWVSTGKDDYLHALVYFKIALERKKMNEGDINT